MKTTRSGKVLSISIATPLLFVLAFAVVVVAYNHFHTPPQVDVLSASFTPQTIRIPEGEALRFVNRSSTITQVLCVGVDKRCDRPGLVSPLQVPPPRSLQSPGIRIAPDQTREVVFDTQGTFHITSTVAAGMNLTVTVIAGT
jgi:plastocyanin